MNPTALTPADLRQEVEAAFRSLPGRYLGAPDGFTSTVQVRITDLGRVYEVRCTTHGVRVRPGTSTRPDVVIATDAATWLGIRRGDESGIEAFSDRRLTVRGDIDRAVGFEGLFRLPNGRPPLLRLRDVRLPGRTVNVLSQGEGPDVVLIHGLGATKTSFFDASATLNHAGYRVHVLDLPGFGSSSKPLRASYDAPWFARTVLGVLDALDIDRAHLVGNSMGGRVAIEMGLSAPQRVGGLVLLCPAVAFVRRGWHPLVRLLRPELGMLPHGFSRATVKRQLFAMFADPDAIDPAVAEIAVDEFRRIYGSPAARHAFLASARNLYLSQPFGDRGFYPALAGLQPPALFIWGARDPLIQAGFSAHVREWLPSAEQIVLERCGHVPQIERPEQTSGIIRRFLERVDALGASAPAREAA